MKLKYAHTQPVFAFRTRQNSELNIRFTLYNYYYDQESSNFAYAKYSTRECKTFGRIFQKFEKYNPHTIYGDPT